MISSLIDTDSSHDHGLVDLPLSDDAVKHLDACVVELSRELEVSNELLDHLLAEHCITREHNETINTFSATSTAWSAPVRAHINPMGMTTHAVDDVRITYQPHGADDPCG